MSLYSVGKNEIRNLIEKEKQLKNELKKLSGDTLQKNIYSFRSIAIKNEMIRIQNKLRVLSFGHDPDDGNVA